MKKQQSWKWFFETVRDAKIFYDSAAEIACKYDYVTLEDLYDLYGWASASPLELLAKRSIKWDFKSIDPHNVSDYVSIIPAFDHPTGYYVVFYECESCEGQATPEPINVTINIPNLTRGIIVDLMQQANEIKDRPVFITITATD